MARRGSRQDYEDEGVMDDTPLTEYVKRKREKERDRLKREQREKKTQRLVDADF